MFYAYIPLFPYMGANLGQMPAAAAAAAARDSSRRPGYGKSLEKKIWSFFGDCFGTKKINACRNQFKYTHCTESIQVLLFYKNRDW